MGNFFYRANIAHEHFGANSAVSALYSISIKEVYLFLDGFSATFFIRRTKKVNIGTHISSPWLSIKQSVQHY